MELHGGAPPLAGHSRGPPTWGCLGSQALLEAFWEKSQKVLSIKIPKSTFTIHDDIFQRPVELKIFMWA